jgi:dolichyl-phosphate-mannose--protein O-mannosyl transferase
LLIVITLLAAVFRVYGIMSQPLHADDVLAAYTADNFMERGHLGPTMAHHPHLRSWLIKGWTFLVGHGPLGLRGVSLIFGVTIVPLIGFLLRKLSGSPLAGLLCAFLIAVDPAHIALSRHAVQDTTTVFFIVLGTLAVVIADKENRPLLLLLAGMSFGLGMASKWHALFPWVIAALWIVWRRPENQGRTAWGLFAGTALVVLPLTIYLATFTPWLMRGYSITEWVILQNDLLVENIHHINQLDLLTNPAKKAWQWVVMPSGYSSFVSKQGVPSVDIAMGHPLAWLLTIPSVVYCASRFIKSRDPWILFLLLMFTASYVPLLLSPRPIFFISALAVMPFAFGLITIAIVGWVSRAGKPVYWITAYCTLVMAVTVALYPLSIGRALETKYLSPLVHSFEPKGLYDKK